MRPSVRPAVRRLPRAAGERAKPAHLSPASAASTFKSRSSFSFTFCQLPSRARVTWGRAPTPICYSGEGGAKLGLRPLHPRPAASGLRAPPLERAGLGAGAYVPRGANLGGTLATYPTQTLESLASLWRPPERRLGAGTRHRWARSVLLPYGRYNRTLCDAHLNQGRSGCTKGLGKVSGLRLGSCLCSSAPRGAPGPVNPCSHYMEAARLLAARWWRAGRLVVSPIPGWSLRERSLLIFHDILNHRTYLPTLPACTKITATIIMIIKRVFYLLHLQGGMGGGGFATPLDCIT